MTLLDELDQIATYVGPKCSVQTILSELDPPDRADIETALSGTRYRSSQIAKVLTNRGYSIRSETIQRHRRGDCRCQSLTS